MIKLFCVPGGAASAVGFLPWSKLLNNNIKLCLLEIPGRGLKRDRVPLKNMDEVADELYYDLISQLEPEDDYMLLGYCFGAVAAYELYRRLKENDIKRPFCVYFCASDPPNGNTYATSLFSDLGRRDEIMQVLQRYFPENAFKNRELVSQFCNNYTNLCYENYAKYNTVIPIKLEQIMNEKSLEGENIFDIEKCVDFSNQTMKLFDIDQTIVQHYQNTSHDFYKVDTSVVVFAGDRDTMTPIDAVKNWDSVCEKDFNLEVIEGGHLIMIDGYQNCIPLINKRVEVFEKENSLV